jgi:hypothetical protein
MKNVKLKIACVLIWTCVVGLFVLFGLQVHSNKKAAEVTPVVQVTGNNNTVNVVNGNNNTFIVAEIVSPLSEKEMVISHWVSKIVTVRAIEYNDEKFSFEDGLALAELIADAAEAAGLTYAQGFVIVYVESDFAKAAFNRNGGAYGLCQITQPCLDEYNWNNSTNYTLNQMLNPNLNLKVGFWYYNRLLTHYKKYSEYGIHDLKDAYIAYNLGVTAFKNVGESGRVSLRNGIYPCSIYGAKKGSYYNPSLRYDKIVSTI